MPLAQRRLMASWAIAGWFKGDDPSLHLPAEITPEVLSPVLDCSVQERHGYTGKYPAKGHIRKGQESWDSSTCVNTWREGGKKMPRLFPVVPSDRTRGCGHKRKADSSFWVSGNCFFIGKMTNYWHRLPREVLESPSLKILSSQLDTVLASWL